jgi:hypothetical protein
MEAQGLSRGYGGRLEGPVRVDPSVHTAADVGDEPLMLAQGAPAWISRDRVAGARAAAARGAQALVLDDGHQNPALRKSVSLIVVDGETRGDEWPFGDGSVFPSGPMREPLKAGLARADAVVVMLPTDVETADPELLAVFGDLPVFVARLTPEGRAADGAAGRVRRYRQTVESRTLAEGGGLRPGRFRSLPRPCGLPTRGSQVPAGPGGDLRRRPGDDGKGLGAAEARSTDPRDGLAGRRPVRG